MKNTTPPKKKIVYDIILGAALLLIALSVFLFVECTRTGGELVTVELDGEEIGRYPLDTDKRVPLKDGKNVLVIEDGKAYMESADCPDKVCVRTGKISRVGEQIVCLPNRVFIRVIGEGDEILPIN